MVEDMAHHVAGDLDGDLGRPKLHHSKTSVCSQKVRLVLAELNVDYQSIVLDLKKGDQFKDAYISLNPNSSVPTLIDGKQILPESNEIMWHLSQKAGAQSHLFLPQDQQEHVASWLAQSVDFHASVHVLTTLAMNRSKMLKLTTEELHKKLDRIPDKARSARILDIVEYGVASRAVRSALDYVETIYRQIDQALKDKAYLCGDEITLADLAILPFVLRLKFLRLKPDWTGASFKHLDEWTELLVQRPSAKTAIMDFHDQKVLDTYNSAGMDARVSIVGALKT